MNNARAALAVGLFTVACIAALMVFVAFSNRGIGKGQGTYQLRASFDDVTGIAEGTKITIAGVRVGEVESMALKGQVVDVRVRLLDHVKLWSGTKSPEGQLRNAASLTRLQASLLGDFYLELALGAGGNELKSGDEIPRVITATALQQTLAKMEKAADIVPKIDQITTDVAKVTHSAAAVFGTDAGAEKIAKITDNLVQASSDLAQTTVTLRERLASGLLAPGGDLDRGLHGFADTASKLSELTSKVDKLINRTGDTIDEGGKSLVRSIDNIEVVTAQVRDLIGRNKSGVDDSIGTVTTALKKVQDTLGRLDKIMSHVESVTADVDAGKGNVGRLLRDESLIKSAEQIMSSSGTLLKKYLDLEIGVDYRIAAHAPIYTGPNDLRWQSHLSLRLQPTPEKYVSATITSSNLPVISSFTRYTDTAGGTTPGVTTERFQDSQPGALRFGVQYARRFGSVTVRGGLIENTAGGGIDWSPIKDRLMVSVDMFRFTEGRPRARASILWMFMPHIYAWVGGDELLYIASRASPFYGLGLSFTDNDLLVLFAASPKVQLGN